MVEGWVKPRKAPTSYTPTQGQATARLRVRAAGKAIGAVCRGLKGQEFKECRRGVLDCEYRDACDPRVRAALDAAREAS